jgi:hypothetical protein
MEMKITIDAEVADRIVYDSLVYYRELLQEETKGLKRKRKLPQHQLEDLGRNVRLLDAMETVMEYFKPVD